MPNTKKILKLASANKAGFNSIEVKENDRVYFVIDTQEIYFGNIKFGGSIEFVTEVPESCIAGTLYVVNAGVGGIYAADGSEVKCIAKGYSTTIDENSTDNSVATALAVYNFVTSAIETASDGLAKKPTYESSTRTITIPVVGDDDVVINLGKDLVVENGVLVDGEGENEGKQFLKLTLTSGDVVTIDLSKLIDIYTGGETDTAEVTVDGNTIKVDVKISNTVGNMLSVDENGGLFVAPTTIDTEDTLSGDTDKIPSSAAVMNFVNNTKTETLETANSYADQAAENAVQQAKDYTDGLIDVKTYYIPEDSDE